MKDEPIAQKYGQLLDEVLAKYKGRIFHYNLGEPILEGDHTLVGIADSRLEFKDARNGSSSYLSIDQFLRDTIKLAPENPAERPKTLVEIEAEQREKEQRQPFRKDDGYVHPNKKY